MAKNSDQKKVEEMINRAIQKHEKKRQSSPACGPLATDIYEELKNEGVIRPEAREA